MAKVVVLLRTPPATHIRIHSLKLIKPITFRETEMERKKSGESPNDNHEKLFLAQIQRTSDRPDEKDL